MRIFLCYSSPDRTVAERIRLRLVADGHDVFQDRTGLEPGDAYDTRIADEIARADHFVFLVSPDSVASGRYTRTELGFAGRRWANPAGAVLPVMVRATPYADIPEYLKAVTVLEPEGDVAAEVAARLRPPRGRAAAAVRRHGWKVAAVVVPLALWGTWRLARPPADIAEFDVGPSAHVPNLPVGATQQLTATLRDLKGRPLDRPVTWITDAPAVASVSLDGLVEARAPGLATISVLTEKGLTRSVTVEVVDSTGSSTVASRDTLFQLPSGSLRMAPGMTEQITPTVLGTDGRQLSGAQPRWSSSNPDVAQVDPAGSVVALRTGMAVVTATLGSHSATARVEVANLATSAGPCPVPTLVGRPYREDEIRALLDQARLGLGQVDTVGAGGPPWVVRDQRPEPGGLTVCGGDVGLVVGRP